MFSMTRKRWVGISSALTMALVLVLMITSMASAAGPVVHRVNVGGSDACAGFGLPPGCDANFSLVAHQYADGTASGQYVDRLPAGNGFHATINCLVVVGNQAWISGVITSGTDYNGQDLTGQPVATRVQDNGTSANDPADKIGYSNWGDGRPCTDQVDYEMFDMPQGQVKVR